MKLTQPELSVLHQIGRAPIYSLLITSDHKTQQDQRGVLNALNRNDIRVLTVDTVRQRKVLYGLEVSSVIYDETTPLDAFTPEEKSILISRVRLPRKHVNQETPAKVGTHE